MDDDINSAIAGLTGRVIAYRIALMVYRGTEMDRLKEKLALAGSVVKRATANIEKDADELIARESEIARHSKQAFAPHHKMLESHKRELDGLEHALKLVSNDPLGESSEEGSSEVGQGGAATFQADK